MTHVLVKDPMRGYGIFIEICRTRQDKGRKHMDFGKVPIRFGMALSMNANTLYAHSSMTETKKQGGSFLPPCFFLQISGFVI